jgi:hypothetical protein
MSLSTMPSVGTVAVGSDRVSTYPLMSLRVTAAVSVIHATLLTVKTGLVVRSVKIPYLSQQVNDGPEVLSY